MDATVKIFGKEFTFNNVSSTIAHKDTYDEEGKAIKTVSTLPLGILTTTYEYDEKGQMTKSIGRLKSTDKSQIPIGKPPRVTNTIERDNQNRIIKAVETVFNGSEEVDTVTDYRYDADGIEGNTIVTTTDDQNHTITIEKYHGDEVEPYFHIVKPMSHPDMYYFRKEIRDGKNTVSGALVKERIVNSKEGENSITLYQETTLKDGTKKFFEQRRSIYSDFHHDHMTYDEVYTYDEFGRIATITRYEPESKHTNKLIHNYKDDDAIYPDTIICEPDRELNIAVLFYEFDPEKGVIPLKEYKPGCYVVYNSMVSDGHKDTPEDNHSRNIDLDSYLHPSGDYAQFQGLDVLYHKDCLTYINLICTVGRFNIEYKTDTEDYKINLIKSTDKDGKKVSMTTLTVSNKDKTGKIDQTIVIQDNDDKLGEITNMILEKSGHNDEIKALNAIAFKAWSLTSVGGDSEEDNSNIVKFKKN